MMKTVSLYCLFMLLNLGCAKKSQQFDFLNGEWQITKFYFNDDDLGSYLNSYTPIICFENDNKFWINVRENRRSKFIDADYSVYKDSSKSMLKIANCKDLKFNHIFEIHVDTIDYTEESFLLKLTLDAENAYIEAVKPKLKYENPPEYRNKKN